MGHFMPNRPLLNSTLFDFSEILEPRLAGKPTELGLEDFSQENPDWAKRIQRLNELRHKIEVNMEKDTERRQKDKDQEIQFPDVHVGDLVYYPNRKLSNKSQNYSAGLGVKYLGPAKVYKLISPIVVELRSAWQSL
ncbi:Protein of unknown function [Cotesia congregata]|uniref:Uncharacterized protein n=1 Tax=Cotesia congregata TaxID=51543 RepID=A0A8J2HAE8_COTCN|nr:Protein of unknown function [Cotesia congregata]